MFWKKICQSKGIARIYEVSYNPHHPKDIGDIQ